MILNIILILLKEEHQYLAIGTKFECSPKQKDSSVFSISWCMDRRALYGSTTTSDTFGEGYTEKLMMILS